VQVLDRELNAYNADKARHTPVKSEEPSNGTDRPPTKPATPSGPNHNNNININKRDSRQQGGDDSYDRDRPRERERLHSRDEDRDDTGRERMRDWEIQRERERSFNYRSDGAGLRSENELRQDRGNSRRQRILSAPMSDEAAFNDMGHQRDHYVNNNISSSYPNSPAVPMGGPFDRYKRNDRPERRYRDSMDRGSRGDVGPMDDRRLSYISQDETMTVKSEQDDSLHSQLSYTRPKMSDSSDTVAAAVNHVKKDERTPEHHSLELARSNPDPSEDTVTVAQGNVNDSDLRHQPNMAKDKEEGALPHDAPPSAGPSQDMVATSQTKTGDGADSAAHVSTEVATKDSTDAKPAGSPTASSLPSPGLSPVHISGEAKATEFENHADILIEIDRIDGKIQRCEELLQQHRDSKKSSVVEDIDILDEVTLIIKEEAPLVVAEPGPPAVDAEMDIDVP
ncbi:hypothetical protein BGZ91_009181, partial [Linnemannia elongata]